MTMKYISLMVIHLILDVSMSLSLFLTQEYYRTKTYVIFYFYFFSTQYLLGPSKYLIKALELEGCICMVPTLKCLRRVAAAG